MENESRLEVVAKEGSNFIVKVPNRDTFEKIEDTFTEMLPIVEISPANSTVILFWRNEFAHISLHLRSRDGMGSLLS
jgi:flavin reductase (DIM6/NTAB) family NADH-FMN oxidoreductase RutF